MRNVVATLLFGLLALNSGIMLAESSHVSNGAKNDKILRTLVEIRDTVKQLKQDSLKAPRYDAPCYGAPGTPVPPQVAIDSAKIVEEICCCLQELIGNINVSNIDQIITAIDSVNATIGTQSAPFVCSDFDTLTCCDTINTREQSVISWLKLIYYTLNHGVCD